MLFTLKGGYIPDDRLNPLNYAAPGAGDEQSRRRVRFGASIFAQLLIGGLITGLLYILLLWIVTGLMLL